MFAAATYFVFDLLVVIGFFIVLLCCTPGSARHLIIVALLMVAVAAASGMWDYLRTLQSISARTSPRLSALFYGLKALLLDEQTRREFVANASTCPGSWGTRYLPCIYESTAILLVPPFLFSLYAIITRKVVYRAMLLYYLPLMFVFWFFATAERISLFGSVHHILIYLIALSANTFVVLPFMVIADDLLVARRRRAATWIMTAISAIGAVLIVGPAIVSFVSAHPPLLHAIAEGRGDVADVETSIVNYLKQE